MADNDQIPCPMRIRGVIGTNAETDEDLHGMIPCGEALFLSWRTAYILRPEDLTVPWRMKHTPDTGETRSWQLECLNGHVLAVSASDDEYPDLTIDDLAELRRMIPDLTNPTKD